MPPWKPACRGFSLLELLIGLAVMAVLLYALYALLSSGRRMEDDFGSHLGLQIDAQKSLMQLVRDLQEGITVVQPAPGNTLPHAVIRDKVNRLVFYSLAPSSVPGELRLRRDIASEHGTQKDYLLGGIRRFTFTTLSDSAVMLNVVLGAGEKRYAFHTEVRLRNRDAAEAE